MAVKVTWDNNEKTLIRLDFEGKWNWYGYEMAVGEGFGLAESVSHDVHFIFNMEQSALFPDGATFYLKRALELSPNNRSRIVIAHADKLAKATVSLFGEVFKRMSSRLLTAPTLARARVMLTNPEAPEPAPKRRGIRFIAAP